MDRLFVYLTIIGILGVKYASFIEIESYTVLPLNNNLCEANQLNIVERRFEVFNKIIFSSGLYNGNKSQLSYVCTAKIIPMGKLIKHSYPNQGDSSFWFLRFKIMLNISNCNDKLIIQLSPKILTNFKTGEVHEYGCLKKSPVKYHSPLIFDTSYRAMHMTWITEGGRLDTGSSFSVHVVTHMLYEGNFTVFKRKELCDNQNGVWCGNETQVCVSQVLCDGIDDCFNGGSDELNCPPKSNETGNGGLSRHPINHGWTGNVPWIVLGILLFAILLFALARICSQKRQLDISEEFKGSSTSDEGDCIIVSPGNTAMTASWNAANGEGVGLYYKSGSRDVDEDADSETVEDIDDKPHINESVELYPPRCDSDSGAGPSCSNVVVMRVDHHDNRSLSTASCASASGTAITLTTNAGGGTVTNHTEDSDDYDYPSPDKESESKLPTTTDSKRNSKVSTTNCSPTSVPIEVNNPIYGSQDELSLTEHQPANIPTPPYEDSSKCKDSPGQSSTPLLEKETSRHSNTESVSSKRNSRESAKSGARDSSARLSLLASNGVANPASTAGKEQDYDRDYIVV